ncbi:deoxyxylulose-5-phosphate synthase [Streptantibioticus ferralitis]|uniref:Deoxyxylulose-5-phosphate synthase n=1 Tax=Streptantibioticus ferralitis TaxID=236510 RepID=A0ABT5YY12_9ACTN|nr:deoxyxylulose-5-phosphate synthase [Streptantibioticus ferralitis]MDF2256430.1 deoxyxylulose-5-phosphate synthase [Streptantibioticus ferralitis]
MPRRSHFVCLPRRVSVKKAPERQQAGAGGCPRRGGELIDVGTAFAAPRRADTAAWRALSAVLYAGLRFHSSDCMGSGPGYRPRTPREVRIRLANAATGFPVARALACPEPGGVSRPA